MFTQNPHQHMTSSKHSFWPWLLVSRTAASSLNSKKHTCAITKNHSIVGICTIGSRPGPWPQDYEEDVGFQGVKGPPAQCRNYIGLLVIPPEAVFACDSTL